MSLLRGPCTRGGGNLDQNARRGFVEDPINCDKTQSVEAVLLEPVERVVNEEVAHGAALLAIVIDGGAPGRLMRGVEELGSIGGKVVPRRPEMVVPDARKNHQRAGMCGGEQPLWTAR